MRATEIIRNILDLIDSIDCSANMDDSGINKIDSDNVVTGVDSNRFKHIVAMLNAGRSADTMYDNTPTEVVSDMSAVTTDAGGGWNGPKNPADIRANSISMFPAWQSEKK